MSLIVALLLRRANVSWSQLQIMIWYAPESFVPDDMLVKMMWRYPRMFGISGVNSTCNHDKLVPAPPLPFQSLLTVGHAKSKLHRINEPTVVHTAPDKCKSYWYKHLLPKHRHKKHTFTVAKILNKSGAFAPEAIPVSAVELPVGAGFWGARQDIFTWGARFFTEKEREILFAAYPDVFQDVTWLSNFSRPTYASAIKSSYFDNIILQCVGSQVLFFISPKQHNCPVAVTPGDCIGAPSDLGVKRQEVLWVTLREGSIVHIPPGWAYGAIVDKGPNVNVRGSGRGREFWNQLSPVQMMHLTRFQVRNRGRTSEAVLARDAELRKQFQSWHFEKCYDPFWALVGKSLL